MPELILELLQKLEPVIALLVILLLIAVVYLWRALILRDAEIDRLIKERNDAVNKKDTYIESLHKETMQLTVNNTEAMTKVAESNNKMVESNERLVEKQDQLITAFYNVLSNINKK